VLNALMLQCGLPPQIKPSPKTDARSMNQSNAENVLKAPRKISSAVEIGINLAEYNRLVLEAKESSDEALRVLPESEFKAAAFEAIYASNFAVRRPLARHQSCALSHTASIHFPKFLHLASTVGVNT
jgi:hypothetical protein